MIYVISYATNGYVPYQQRLSKQVAELGYVHYTFGDDWLKRQPYYKTNQSILDEKRGAGFWAWKPYIMLHVLDRIEPDDVALYLDSNIIIHSNPTDLITDKRGLFIVGTSFINKAWTKRDCFQVMDCDNERYWDACQVWAGIICMRSTMECKAIVREWLQYAQDRRAITDDASVAPNFPEFIDHRHDQSILTNLQVKYNIPLAHISIFEDG